MKVTVRFYAHLRDLTGKKSPIELNLEEDATISQVLEELLKDLKIKTTLLDDNQEIKSDITLLKNGREIKFLDGLDTTLDEGDIISVFPIVAGG